MIAACVDETLVCEFMNNHNHNRTAELSTDGGKGGFLIHTSYEENASHEFFSSNYLIQSFDSVLTAAADFNS